MSELQVNGVGLIAAERQRQIEIKGWTPDHDFENNTQHQLIAAAICYAHNAGQIKMAPPRQWPWMQEWWKPTTDDSIRDLTKAGALIAAEIDRLQRVKDGAANGS